MKKRYFIVGFAYSGATKMSLSTGNATYSFSRFPSRKELTENLESQHPEAKHLGIISVSEISEEDYKAYTVV